MLFRSVGDSGARDKVLPQPAGWQRVMAVVSSGLSSKEKDLDVSSLTCHSGAMGKVLLAIGLVNGTVTVVDCAPTRGPPKIAWTADLGMGSIGTGAFDILLSIHCAVFMPAFFVPSCTLDTNKGRTQSFWSPKFV